MGGIVSHSHEGGVVIAQNEASAGTQQAGHNTRPGVDVRQPAQDAQRGVDQVEVTGHNLTGRIDVGLNQLDAGLGPTCQLPGPLQRARGHVEADDASRSQPGQADGIEPQVALEMDDVEAAYVPQTSQVMGSCL